MPKEPDFTKDDMSALDAISKAQEIAFAPMLFQAAYCLRESGILAALDRARKQGLTFAGICQQVSLNEYAVQLLLDVGLTGRLVYRQGDAYLLGKTGHFILHDEMTRVNMDFTQHVCYLGMFSLKEALEQMKPAGLKVFDASWQTIYPHLSQLPQPARKSWFDFDHFYSSAAFGAARKIIAQYKPAILNDIGGNTGKWALAYCEVDPDACVVIIDLPQQIALMQDNVAVTPFSQRISGIAANVLSADPLPANGADIWWMSQFLDCFESSQIVAILDKVRQAMKPGAKVAILECFWDCQPQAAGAFSLATSSLYFTAMANGNSRFYAIKAFEALLAQAGLVVERAEHGLGVGHTLLVCGKQ